MTIIAAIVAGMALPITPVQILWVNMITAVTLAVALAFEPPEKGIMQAPPRNPDQPLLTGLFLWRIGFVSVTRCIGTFALFLWGLHHVGVDEDYARTMAVNTLVMFEVFYLLNVRSIHGSGLTLATWVGSPIALLAMATVVVGQLVFTYAPWFQEWFQTRSIGVMEWAVIVGVSLFSYFVVEAEKWGLRRWRARRRA
jgi:magnesium-transporting ATPase (P-type)